MMDYNTMLKAHQEIEVAKERIVSGDYIAARRKLLEVQRRLPAFDDISGMIAICDILYTAGLGFLGCGTDCYWVLWLSPEASESDIQYQYNKFTDLLEPINNFPGAASALKIIQHAFLVLSDPEKRSMFDKKRVARLETYESENSQETHAVKSQQGCLLTESLVQKEENSLSPTRCKRTACETLDGNNYASSSIQIFSKIINYLGERQDHDAELPIQADFTNPHVVDGKPANSIPFSVVDSDGFSEKLSWAMTSMAGKSCQDQYNFNNIRKAEAFAVGQIWATYDEEDMPRRYAQIIGINQTPFRLHINWLKPAPIAAHETRWCEVGLPVVCGQFYVDRNKITVIEPTLFSHMVSRYASERVEIYPKRGEIWAVYKDWKPIEWCLNPEARKGCTLQIAEVSFNCSNEADVLALGLVKVEGFKNVYKRCTDNGSSECPIRIPRKKLFMFSHRVPAYIFVGGEMDGIFDGMFALDPIAVPNVLDCITRNGSSSDSTFKLNHAMPPLLPSDAGSKPLKLKWSVKEFASDQIWAVHDGPDLMPRQYAVVNNVVSWSEVCVTYLEPQPVLDDDIYWVEENIPLVCGLFRAGETTLNMGLSRFSHMVKCEQSTDKSLFMIYPKTGEIWAMYRDWNSRWKHVDITHYQCKIVEIVTGFSEDSGLMVASLEQVPGCKTFFQRQLCNGFELIRAVPRTEMLSFSHQIPAFTVPEVEIRGIPQGSWHLEPDALPPNLSPTSNINL